MASDGTAKLAALAAAITNINALDKVCSALDVGRLRKSSSSSRRHVIAGGRSELEPLLSELQTVWSAYFASVNASTISLILRTVSAAVENERTFNPSAQVVWTGPKVNGSYFRATRQVVRELVSHSTDHMLVVGYWLAGAAGNLSIINEIVDSIAEAVRERQVEVSMVLDTGLRPDDSSNYDVLQSLWPTDLPLPYLLTWNIPDNEPHLKIHAKVIVCDRKEALVTSANLTQHALERNIEMGLHIYGDACLRITQHFDLLETQGILEPFSNDSMT